MKNFRKWLLKSFCMLAILVIFFPACSHRNPDISRVVNPYWDKAYFNTQWQKHALGEKEWYYRLTVVDTPVNTQAASIGDGHWLHPETIRWEITENLLIGWRAHAAVPGADGELKEGASKNYRGTAVVAFKVKEHFDINRSYDDLTLEQRNEIVENTSDRPWYDRRFFRIDFGKNLIGDLDRNDPYGHIWGGEKLGAETSYVVQQNDPADPRRYRFDNAYFELTTRQGITVDILGFYGGYGEAFQYDSASPVVDIRHSFMKKPETNDYEPLHYPDNVKMSDENGNVIRDNHGHDKLLPIWEKFGFYRANFSGRQTWDSHRGSVESGKNLNITRFNIWESTRREDGSLIPIQEREPKAIEYYTNVGHPESLLGASRRVAEEWSKAFQKVVYYAQPGKYASIDEVPTMFVLHQNSCNHANVAGELDKRGEEFSGKVRSAANVDFEALVSQIALANNADNEASFSDRHNLEAQAKADLEKVCSAMEFFSQSSDDPFHYQRPGDLRYNMFNLVTKRAPTQWSGLGPMLADSLTGEIIQATANVNLWYVDKRASVAADQIEALNGKIAFGDLIDGQDVERYITQKMAENRAHMNHKPNDKALAKMDRTFEALDASGETFREMSPLAVNSRLERVAHSDFEKKLFDPKGMEHLLAGFGSTSSRHGDLAEGLLNGISPARGNDLAQRVLRQKEREAQNALTVRDPPEFLDNLVVGVALQYRAMNRRDLFEKVREAVYTAVMLHEVGHNVGLTHNMAASSDALNYGEKFWELEALPKDISDAMAQTSDPKIRVMLGSCLDDQQRLEQLGEEIGVNYSLNTQDCLRQQEGMYSSIMDYHAMWNSDLNGLGKYDEAAIKFGYAQLVEVYPEENLALTSGNQNLKDWLFLNDWRKIPTQFVSSPDKIYERSHAKYDWGYHNTNFSPPKNEVPYRYCIDSSGAHGPNCRAFDYGPDMRSEAQWLMTRYWQHYFFTHFARNKAWTYDYDFQRVAGQDLRIFDRFNGIMKWYYYYKATHPGFSGSDAEKDYLAATVTGLNHFSHVLGHPKPGIHITAPNYVVESSLALSPAENRLEPSKIMIPWDNLGECAAKNSALVMHGLPAAPMPGYQASLVKLGEGRPFYVGLTEDYEDWHVKYVGSFYSKLFAGFFLGYPGSWFPRTDSLHDPRFYAVNWYRLFPDEVGKVFYNLITENWGELGPLVDANGKLHRRDLLDPQTLKAPDYSHMTQVRPTMSSFMPYRTMYYAGSLMSGHLDTEFDFTKSMKVSVRGSEDDLTTFDGLDQGLIETFVHPNQGYTYRALKAGKFPIAYDLVKKVNKLKERYERLDGCVNDDTLRENDLFCRCVKLRHLMPDGAKKCCEPTNALCSAPGLQKVGEGDCSMGDLENRRDRAVEAMNEAVGFLDDMRWMEKTFNNRL